MQCCLLSPPKIILAIILAPISGRWPCKNQLPGSSKTARSHCRTTRPIGPRSAVSLLELWVQWGFVSGLLQKNWFCKGQLDHLLKKARARRRKLPVSKDRCRSCAVCRGVLPGCQQHEGGRVGAMNGYCWEVLSSPRNAHLLYVAWFVI